MSDPYRPSQPGEYIPPPAYQGASDIPPESPYHSQPAPQQNSRGLMGGLISAALAVWAVLEPRLLVLVRIPAWGTLRSRVVSFGGYALLYGPGFAVALVPMILVPE